MEEKTTQQTQEIEAKPIEPIKMSFVPPPKITTGVKITRGDKK